MYSSNTTQTLQNATKYIHNTFFFIKEEKKKQLIDELETSLSIEI